MSRRRRISMAERRARLAVRHRLAAAARSATLCEAADSVVGLHATDPASVFLEARARMASATIEAIEHELYDEPTVIRMLGMRRTLFVVPLETAPIVHAAASRAIAAAERKR
ncbi:MAG: DNA glycosylase AlkZ-like family protein, partial [Chloroflexota bacterium]